MSGVFPPQSRHEPTKGVGIRHVGVCEGAGLRVEPMLRRAGAGRRGWRGREKRGRRRRWREREGGAEWIGLGERGGCKRGREG